ncbi:MAG: O-antigen ligase family protein [Candidatus Wallbacteria bacterium]|nr:O-antigen ligase family protein [Candidatus Wallbacteria bacterium]
MRGSVFLAALFLAPFVRCVENYESYLAKTEILSVAVGITVIGVLLCSGRFHFFKAAPVPALTALLSFCSFRLFVSQAPGLGISNLLGMVLLLLVIQWTANEKHDEFLLKKVLIVQGWIMLIALSWLAASQIPGGMVWDPSRFFWSVPNIDFSESFFTGRNYYAVYAGFISLLLYGRYRIKVLPLLLLGSGIALGSRTVAVALCVVACGRVVTRYSGISHSRLYSLILACGLTACLMVSSGGESAFRHASFQSRIMAWKSCLYQTRKNPLFGTGGGSFQRELSGNYPRFDAKVALTRDRMKFAHNDYLEILGENGIIGFVLFIAFCISCLKTVDRNSADAVLFLLLCGLTDIPGQMGHCVFLFGVVLGMDLAAGQRVDTSGGMIKAAVILLSLWAVSTSIAFLYSQHSLGQALRMQTGREKKLERAMLLRPWHTDTLIWNARQSVKAGNLQRAAELCVRALAADPWNHDVHFEYGSVLMLLKKFKEASEHFDQYRILEDDSRAGHTRLLHMIEAYYHAGRKQDVMKIVDALDQRAPDLAWRALDRISRWEQTNMQK